MNANERRYDKLLIEPQINTETHGSIIGGRWAAQVILVYPCSSVFIRGKILSI